VYNCEIHPGAIILCSVNTEVDVRMEIVLFSAAPRCACNYYYHHYTTTCALRLTLTAHSILQIEIVKE
jgi:hypothetical protein